MAKPMRYTLLLYREPAEAPFSLPRLPAGALAVLGLTLETAEPANLQIKAIRRLFLTLGQSRLTCKPTQQQQPAVAERVNMVATLAEQLLTISRDLAEESWILQVRGQQDSAFRLADLASQVDYAARELTATLEPVAPAM